MDVFTMVVLIVLIAVVGTTVGKYFKARGGAEGRGSAEQEARIAKLEARVRALETVVTDHGFDLKRELRELERS
jgi:hypothetical protein